MPTKSHQITVDGLVVDVVRKDIKNLNLRVYAPDGRVRVSVPRHVSDQAVRQAVASRMGWIERKRRKLQAQVQQPPPQYVSGETHTYQGRPYVLNVVYVAGRARVAIRNQTTLDLFVRPGSDAATRERVLREWYRARLKEAMPALVAKWEAIIGVQVGEWRVKRMRTRWGSCNVGARRIWVNLELVKRPVRCLEYVIVHEIVHLLERRHGKRFVALVDRFMPQWRALREELKRAPLASAD
jgi:predicted metal-dependent hydrolase